jgi:K+-transporting ATPase KdpF subunit
MTLGTVGLLIICGLLLGYLFYALLRAEKF